ncbi:MAG: rubredoxin [Methanospirillaceae archaeon]|nr:rubredoxin [Methanospirillaceae archaeon]
MARWKCTKCGYLYNESMGDSAHGIPANTLFSDLPDNWVCPRCGVSKIRFVRKE